MKSKNKGKLVKKFGTFGGVFTPNVLTILGVIMYLRLGWVVGNAGLLGAIAIILLAKSVTICTALSMSSITTNIKIGAGGAYSIISKSLGLEAGGSIGIPLYFSQTLSAALYIFGFTEGWIRIFPTHTPMLVSAIVWGVLLLISYISSQFAIRIQYIIMVIIAASIVSFFLIPSEPVAKVTLIGDFEQTGFWVIFAIFFPAVTGIMAGANLSGDLKDPRKSIPLGTLTSIAITTAIYIAFACVAAFYISPEELRNNQMVMADKALWETVVIVGILAATFSSALGSLLGAPRILQALAEHKTIPLHRLFAMKTKSNEPRIAIVFTSILIIISLMLGDLNAIATLITMFFLITYGMLNIVVFIQQNMHIISFRPTFKTPRIVSFIGASGCIGIMFLINPIFSLVAFLVIFALYVWLTQRGLQANWGDIRGGMFLVLAERASRLAAQFPKHQISWKPDLLVPIDDPQIWSGALLFIRNITYPSGSIFAFSAKDKDLEKIEIDLEGLLSPLDEQGIMVSSTVIEDVDFVHGAKIVIQTLKAGAFRPNILFLTLGNIEDKDHIIRELSDHSTQHELGMIILRQHPQMAFGMQKIVNLWLRDKSPNWNLAMLIALQLQMNWDGHLNLITVATTPDDEDHLHALLDRMGDQARLPALTEYHVLTGSFESALKNAPRADINIFGLSEQPSFKFMRNIPETINSSCLYIKDSGLESALV